MAHCAQCGCEFSAGPADASHLCAGCAAEGAEHPDVARDEAVYHRPPRVSINTILIVANVLVYLAMVLRGIPPMHPSSEQLLKWGANFGPFTLDNQPWRLFTCLFLHIGLVHLALNMWTLYNVGELAEAIYGQATFLAIYLLSGLAGSVGSIVRHSLGVSAGASGAIFGVAGALIATLLLGHFAIPRRVLRVTLIVLVVFAVYSLGAGFLNTGVDNGAHIGGFIAGLILGTVMARDYRHPSEPHSDSRAWLLPAMCVLIAATFFSLRYMHAPQIHEYKAEEALSKGDNKLALAELNAALARQPSVVLYTSQGDVYLRMKQLDQAEASYKKAIALNAKDVVPRHRLADIYLRQTKVEEARQELQQITELQPNDALAYFQLALILQGTGKHDEALATMKKSVAANPNFPPAQFNLGLLEMQSKQYDAAVANFQQFAKLAPNDPDAFQWLGNAYEAKGMEKEAQVAYAKLYELRRARGPKQR